MFSFLVFAYTHKKNIFLLNNLYAEHIQVNLQYLSTKLFVFFTHQYIRTEAFTLMQENTLARHVQKTRNARMLLMQICAIQWRIFEKLLKIRKISYNMRQKRIILLEKKT